MKLSPNIDLTDPYADCEHVVGGMWGNHVQFYDGLPAFTADVDPDDLVRLTIWGHLPPDNRIEEGHHITAEYENSWVTFVVTDVDWKMNPRDMFFGHCDLVRVCAKDDGVSMYYRTQKPLVGMLTKTVVWVKNKLTIAA